MGYRADIMGDAEITPPLNRAENAYLLALAQTRSGDASRCPWVPRARGHVLTPDGVAHDGVAQYHRTMQWLRYLIATLLAPGGAAAASAAPEFDSFTFDHVLNGAFAARRRDTGRLWLVTLCANRIREEVVTPGVASAGRYREPVDELALRRQQLELVDGPAGKGGDTLVPFVSSRRW